jgi:hypothetical protein
MNEILGECICEEWARTSDSTGYNKASQLRETMVAVYGQLGRGIVARCTEGNVGGTSTYYMTS